MFTLEIKTDNEAFTEQPLEEIARILRATADKLLGGKLSGPCMDVNGNKVGRFEYEEEA